MDMYNDGNLVVDGNFDDPRLTDYQARRRLCGGQQLSSLAYHFSRCPRP